MYVSANGRRGGKFMRAFTSALPEGIELITERQTQAGRCLSVAGKAREAITLSAGNITWLSQYQPS